MDSTAAIFLTTPSGRQVLVDGGPSPATLTSALGRQMPFWHRSIDRVVLTHPGAGHSSGLPAVLDRTQAGGWLENGRAEEDAAYRLCQNMLAQKGLARRVVRNTVLEVLHPPAAAAPAGPG